MVDIQVGVILEVLQFNVFVSLCICYVQFFDLEVQFLVNFGEQYLQLKVVCVQVVSMCIFIILELDCICVLFKNNYQCVVGDCDVLQVCYNDMQKLLVQISDFCMWLMQL